jgi:hypothetical protein
MVQLAEISDPKHLSFDAIVDDIVKSLPDDGGSCGISRATTFTGV